MWPHDIVCVFWVGDEYNRPCVQPHVHKRDQVMINGQHSVTETEKEGKKLILVSTPPKKHLRGQTAQVLLAASLLHRGSGMARVREAWRE